MKRRNCVNCEGAGVARCDPGKKCVRCGGRGYFEPPDESAIRGVIFSRTGRLVTVRPRDPRAYFVWRLARFWGGDDVVLPVMAYVLISGDPFLPELEALADRVAEEVYGTSLAPVARWAPLLF